MTSFDATPTDLHDIVVTGSGLCTSLGATVGDNWRRIVAGEIGLAPVTCFDVSEAQVKDGGVAPSPPGFDPADARRDGRTRALAHYKATIAEALRGAGYGDRTRDPERTALVVGSSLAASASSNTFWERYLAEGPGAADYRELESYDVEPMLAELSETFDIGGEAVLVSNACAAGASAIALARELVLGGEADVVIAVGGDTLEPHTFAGFHALGLLSPEPLRPFGEARCGMQLGDGFGALVIEREAHARSTPLARLLGCGESGDAHSLTQPHPEGAGAAQAMHRALRVAGLTAADIDYVNLHATATPSNDSSEFAALRSVFGERLPEVSLHALKPSFGHTLGAAGAVEAVVTIEALRAQLVPETLGVDGELEFDGVRFESGERSIEYAMSNSFGFGGANASLVFGRYGERTR